MTQQIINVGSNELAGDGESLRTAFVKVNSNFTELYTTGGPVGPQGPSGDTGPTGPQGPGADQELNTNSNVSFRNLSIATTSTFNGPVLLNSSTNFVSTKAIFAGSQTGSLIELWNERSDVSDVNSILFLRKRGSSALLPNQTIGSIQFDGWQPINGYAKQYPNNKNFPGIRVDAGSVWNQNSAATEIKLLNRVSYNPLYPFPYNQPNNNSTDTTVIETLVATPNVVSFHSFNFSMHEPLQGFNNLSTNVLTQVAETGVFGIQRILPARTNSGNYFRVANNSAYSSSTNELLGIPSDISFRVRTDHVGYWQQGFGGLNTSTQGQITWIAGNTSTWSNNKNAPSIVKGASLNLNSIRYHESQRRGD